VGVKGLNAFLHHGVVTGRCGCLSMCAVVVSTYFNRYRLDNLFSCPNILYQPLSSSSSGLDWTITRLSPPVCHQEYERAIYELDRQCTRKTPLPQRLSFAFHQPDLHRRCSLPAHRLLAQSIQLASRKPVEKMRNHPLGWCES
jgi:hypothetical protein